jgi:hypothetical protein
MSASSVTHVRLPFSIAMVSLLCASVAYSGPTGPTVTVAPKPGPVAGPTIPPNVSIKTSVTLVPAVTGERPATNAQLVRTLSGGGRCAIGEECIVYGRGLGTHGLGASPPNGIKLTYRPASPVVSVTPAAGLKAGSPLVGSTPTKASDPNVTVTPTVWTPSLVGFAVPSTAAEGSYVISIRSTTTGAATVNELPVTFVIRSDARDFDNDGQEGMKGTGADCDDLDPLRTPGRAEAPDDTDHDEDCDPRTFGNRDRDGDGAQDASACNVSVMGSGLDRSLTWLCGTDCDDGNNAITPGAMTCDPRDPAAVFICRGKTAAWSFDPRRTPVRGLWEPYGCTGWGPQGTCALQPNRTGACQ